MFKARVSQMYDDINKHSRFIVVQSNWRVFWEVKKDTG